jgi:cystathionine beta-lyase
MTIDYRRFHDKNGKMATAHGTGVLVGAIIVAVSAALFRNNDIRPTALAVVFAVSAQLFLLWRKKRQTSNRSTNNNNFNELVDRSSIYSVKYDLRPTNAPSASPLWVADMDLPIAPSIQQALIKRASHPCGFGYTIQPQVAWDAVARWLLHHFDWQVDPSRDIVFSASIVTSLATIVQTFTNVDDAVLCMTPLFHPLQQAVLGSRRKLIRHQLEIFLDDDEIGVGRGSSRYHFDLDRLQNEIRSNDVKILILCNPHNPSGRVWSPIELASLVEVCVKSNVLIVSDEIWSDWVFDWYSTSTSSTRLQKHTPIASVHPAAQEICITLMAPTKTWNLAGLHCSFLVIQNSALMEQYQRAIEPACLHFGSAFATEALLATYHGGGGGDGGASNGSKNGSINPAQVWLTQVKMYVKENIQFLMTFCQEYMADEIRVIRPEATYLVWLDCSGMMERLIIDGDGSHDDPQTFFLRQANVLLSAGSEFGPDTLQFCRINVACPLPLLQAVLVRMRDSLLLLAPPLASHPTPQAVENTLKNRALDLLQPKKSK